MRRWQTRDELVLRTVTLHRDGMSRRAIARTLGISRNTVKKILAGHAKAREQPHTALAEPPTRAPRPKKTDAYRERVSQLLDKYPTITAQRVFEILTDEGYDGGQTAVKKLVRELRPKPKPKPSLKTPDWGPGKMAESDWSPYEVELTGGRKLKLQFFSYVLTHSKRPHYEVFDSYGVHALMAGHVAAFERFGGLAETCKYDGQAAVARWEGNQPIYNPRFLAFCAHYEMKPWAIRGNPNLRPNVERSFWSLERSFFVGRDFVDLDDLRGQLRGWLDRTVDHRRRHGTTVLERFAEEAPHLVPLPRHPYDTARVLYRVCSIDGFVEYGGNRYAVPYDHVTDILPVRVTERELFVYAADFECVARHELLERGGHRELDPAGFHSRRSRPAIDLDHLEQTYEGMGEGAARFFGLLSRGPARTWSAPARRMLTLRERYATADLDAALGHAARYGALGYDAVERILEARHRPRRLDEWVAEQTAERLATVLGERRTERSDLSEYDRLAELGEEETSDGEHEHEGED
jgi:transposase